MEKFGVWPGTFVHCYADGWLEKFFLALEENDSWLKTSTPAEYIASHLPLGRADLPSASYAEMMEWVLPTDTRLRYFAIEKEFAARPDLLSLHSRRLLARILPQVPRIQSTAQENAARLGLRRFCAAAPLQR